MRSIVVALALAALLVLLADGRPPSAAGQVSTAVSAPAATNGRIAFVLGKSAAKCQGRFGDLATAYPDGSQCRVLTRTGDAEFPALNPKGDMIAFTRAQPRASAISLIRVDGKGERELIRGPAYEPTWSPDGNRIAFAGQQSGSSQIYIADAHTGAIQAQLTSGPGDNSSPAWSPDGTEIAFISNRDGSGRLYVMQADGAGQQPLTADGGADSDPAWSPDSQRIAFANDQAAPPTSQIYQVNRDGTGESRVTNDALNDQSPSWSPDGRLIAFTGHSGARANTIRLAPASGASPHGPLPHFSGEQPVWAPLPTPSTPVPGLAVNATPHGEVQVQPEGSSLAEPLNGPVSVPVTAGAPTIFRPARGASVTLETRLKRGRSSVITLRGGAVAVSQPGGESTQIELMGDASNSCRSSVATAAKVADLLYWRISDRGNAPPRAVHGYAKLYFQGTDASVRDMCRTAHGLQNLKVVVFKGSVLLNGVAVTPSVGPSCKGSRRGSNDLSSRRVSPGVLQLLRGSHGRICSRGRYAAATVRG